MSISLQKQAVGIVLAKRKLPSLIAEVKLAIDISGSMADEYRDGTVQAIVDRCLAIASKFDDNGELEAWTFSSGFSTLKPITEDMHEDYVKKHILNDSSVTKWGGTEYAPVMKEIVDNTFGSSNAVSNAVGFIGKLFGKKPTPVQAASSKEHPAFVIFITDGENSDSSQTLQVLESNVDKNIYWMMVGIGHSSFKFCEKVADKYENVGFTHIRSLDKMSDEDFYLELLNEEFCNWARKFAK